MDVPKRVFGETGLEVSILGLGAAQIGGKHISAKAAEKFLNGVLDNGVNLIDTARGYGVSEERIGKFLSHRRREFVLSTKVGYDVEGYQDWSKGTVLAGIERALRLLRTDTLDIVHLHSCDIDVLQAGEVIDELAQARQAGKIRFAAYSGENEALDFAINCGGFQSVQFSINICDQRSIETALVKASQKKFGVIAKRPAANVFWQYTKRPSGKYSEAYWLRAQAMQLSPGDLPWLEFALRFAVFTPGVHTAIVGTSSLEHFTENLQIVSKGPLPEEVYRCARQQFKKCDQDWSGQV